MTTSLPRCVRRHRLPAGTRIALRARAGEELACEVLAPLDHGSSSHTHLARDDRGRHLVLKSSRWVEAGQVEADLRVEEQVLGQVSSPALIQLLGSGRGPGGELVFAYERAFPNPLLVLSRPDVRRHFPDPGHRFVPLPPALTLRLGRDLLLGIGQLHAQGFVHHDVKLANLMVRLSAIDPTRQDVPAHEVLSEALAGRAQGVLIDLGGARSLAYLTELAVGRASDDARFVPPQLTPLYAPPEALVGSGSSGGRVFHSSLDLYAAAVVLYTCATGKLPYEGAAVDFETWDGLPEAKAAEQRSGLTPLSFTALRRSPGYAPIAGDLFGLFRALMHRDPDQRPRARLARQVLERLLQALPQ